MRTDAEGPIPGLPDESEYPAGLLERCELLERLSGGEEKETLLARDRESGMLYTVKCYLSGSSLYDRTEPEALKTLDAPPLPRFVAEYRNEGMRCVLRDYVEGRTLAEAAAERSWSEEEVRGVGLQLSAQLALLQSQTPPIIHRDVKPQNAILRSDGTAVLIDFDIARVQSERSTDTVVLGTLGFAPPEQFGYARTDERSDVYSLGVLLRWLLTGTTEPQKTAKTPLERVLKRCTSFDPEERYADASALHRALERAKPGADHRRRIVVAAAALCAVALLVLALVLPGRGARGPRFAEPLLEQAARMQLGLGEEEPLTEERLAGVTELYLLGDQVLPDEAAFNESMDRWYASGMPARGSLSTLEDLRLLPNLERFCAAAEQIEDLTPLSGLTHLERLELKHNQIADLTPLAGLETLHSLGLNDNPVRDLSPLKGCPRLAFLDLCDAEDYDPASLASLGGFEYLDLSNQTASYRYLSGKYVRELRLTWTDLDDLTVLDGVAGLEVLDLSHSRVRDLTPLKNHPELTRLNLAHLPLTDLSVLRELPALESVTLSKSQSLLLEALGEPGFAVAFE